MLGVMEQRLPAPTEPARLCGSGAGELIRIVLCSLIEARLRAVPNSCPWIIGREISSFVMDCFLKDADRPNNTLGDGEARPNNTLGDGEAGLANTGLGKAGLGKAGLGVARDNVSSLEGLAMTLVTVVGERAIDQLNSLPKVIVGDPFVGDTASSLSGAGVLPDFPRVNINPLILLLLESLGLS